VFHRRHRIAVASILAVACAACGLAPVVSGAPHKAVKIVDYDFAPKRLTVAKGTKVTWRWSAKNVASHNVHLIKAPKGVKHFKGGGRHGQPVRHAKAYTRTLRKAGTYRFVCDLHTFMTLKITVKR
jgi:plastocyanin